MQKHTFGGLWTEEKLDILRQYLNFYTNALKNQPFKLIYIDAFAGTGSREQKDNPNLELLEKTTSLDGSVKIALNTTVPFNSYHFVEIDKKKIDDLNELRKKHSNKKINLHNDDANFVIRNLCEVTNWKENRAVIFIDPYGMEVEWETLTYISKTKAIDLWYLFPTNGVIRQLNKTLSSIEREEKYKSEAIDRIFGNCDWRNEFYKIETPQQNDLFGDIALEPLKDTNIRKLEEFTKKRLETIFPVVAKPLVLPQKGAQLFSLFFCVSNPNEKAIGLSMRAANYILQNS